jgi:hypothetical protein
MFRASESNWTRMSRTNTEKRRRSFLEIEKGTDAAGAFSFIRYRYSVSMRRFLRFRLRASASLVRRFSPGFK